MDGSPGGAVGSCQLALAVPVLAVFEDCFAIWLERPSADVAAFEAGSPHAGADALNDQVAFELGDGADDHYDGPA